MKKLVALHFQAGFTFANTSRKHIFKGLDFVLSFLFSATFFVQCSKLEELFKPFLCSRMVILLLGYGYMRYKVAIICYPRSWMDNDGAMLKPI